MEENEKILAFVEDKLSKEERDQFLERMGADIRFREGVLLEKQLWETQNLESWSAVKQVDEKKLTEYEQLFRSEETVSLKTAIAEASNQYHKGTKKKGKSKFFYLGAAIVILLITMNIFLFQNSSPEELYVQYYDIEEIPSLVSRGSDTSESLLVNAQEFFENKQYVEALSILNEQLPTVVKNKGTLMLYKGLSEIELSKLSDAIKTFDDLSKSDLLDASKGVWYKALIAIKLDEIEGAKELLKTIGESPTNYKYKEAKELLGKL